MSLKMHSRFGETYYNEIKIFFILLVFKSFKKLYNNLKKIINSNTHS